MGGEVNDYSAAPQGTCPQRVEDARGIAAGDDGQVDTVIVEDARPRRWSRSRDERDARLIVVGTHGESPMKGALLGSTPHKLLQLADRPVLVVPSPED